MIQFELEVNASFHHCFHRSLAFFINCVCIIEKLKRRAFADLCMYIYVHKVFKKTLLCLPRFNWNPKNCPYIRIRQRKDVHSLIEASLEIHSSTYLSGYITVNIFHSLYETVTTINMPHMAKHTTSSLVLFRIKNEIWRICWTLCLQYVPAFKTNGENPFSNFKR